jgi:hypothetical protein
VGVPQPRTVEVHPHTRRARQFPHPVDRLERLHGPAPEVVGVLDDDGGGRYEVRAGVWPHHRRPPGQGSSSPRDACQVRVVTHDNRSRSTELGADDVGILVAEQFLARSDEQPHTELVGHRAGWGEHTGLVPQQPRHPSLELGDRRSSP